MAMQEGSVTINPSTGAATGSGCAKEIFDALDGSQDYQELVANQLAVAREQISVMARAVAKVIPHIKSNAEVNTDVDTTVAAGIPVQVVVATGTGATNGLGSGSGSGVGTVS